MRVLRASVVVTLLAVAGCAESRPAAFLGGVETRELRASKTGREYQVSVAVPLGYEQSVERYSVLVGVDANGQFGTLVETARLLKLGAHIPPLVIVGVGFPVGGYQTLSRPRRLHELYPTVVDDFVETMAAANPDQPPPTGSGGGPELLDFIVSDVLPFVDANYRTEATGRALYGHSAGGTFAFHALLNSGGVFTRYIIGSPALWWDDRAAFRLEAQYAAVHDELPAKVFLSVGLLESDTLSPPLGSGLMVSNVRDLEEVLAARHYRGLVWNTHYFEDENHQSVVGPTISRGLRYIYQE